MIGDCIAKTVFTPAFSDSWNKKEQKFFCSEFCENFLYIGSTTSDLIVE
jgi:hypothetical protein